MNTLTAPTPVDEDQLVRDHLFLVRAAVAELTSRMPSHAPRDDLRSAGMVGLAQAARSYDASRGVPFHRYAATRIKGALLDELRAQDWASRPVRARGRQLEQARERLIGSLGRQPTEEELAEAMGVEPATVRSLHHDLHRAVVLDIDAMVNGAECEGAPVSDADPEAAMLDRERSAYLVDAVRALPERLRTVVIGYFFEDRSMQDLGNELGVSESRVSQLRAEALDLLRDGINSQLEPSLMPQRPTEGRVARRLAAYFAAIAAASTPRERLGSRPRYRPLAA